jgi:hypothetical protein
MDISSVKLVINEINTLIQKELWYDFSVKQYLDNELVVEGGLSLSYPDIEIVFQGIFFTSLLFDWKTNTKQRVLTLVEGDEERLINQRFQVDYHHYIFKFSPEDYPIDFGCYIAAKEISYRINKPK